MKLHLAGDMTSLAHNVIQGNKLALARLLTQIENSTNEGKAALAELFPLTGKAHLVGITGAPGTGKSTLVNHLARFYRDPGNGEVRKVGVVAVDPSSPFSGGAILGDRVRMRDLAGDEGVFIRSMASRGSLGGLAASTAGVVQALDAAGFEMILIETVGAGQAEVDIARLAHSTLVIEAPGLGDDIQAIKAGILEIADVLVVNKADRPGVEATERALRSMLQLAHPVPRVFQNQGHHKSDNTTEDKNMTGLAGSPTSSVTWVPPILRTIATEGAGIAELAAAIARHQRYLLESGEMELRERARFQSELDVLLRETLLSRWRTTVSQEQYERALDQLVTRKLSPWQAVEELTRGGE